MPDKSATSKSPQSNKKLFICYSREQYTDLADRIYSILKAQDGVDLYVENHDYELDGWEGRVRERLRNTDLFIYLVCGAIGEGQKKEAIIFSEVCQVHQWKFNERAIVGKLVLNGQHPAIEPDCYKPASVRVEESKVPVITML